MEDGYDYNFVERQRYAIIVRDKQREIDRQLEEERKKVEAAKAKDEESNEYNDNMNDIEENDFVRPIIKFSRKQKRNNRYNSMSVEEKPNTA